MQFEKKYLAITMQWSVSKLTNAANCAYVRIISYLQRSFTIKSHDLYVCVLYVNVDCATGVMRRQHRKKNENGTKRAKWTQNNKNITQNKHFCNKYSIRSHIGLEYEKKKWAKEEKKHSAFGNNGNIWTL